jgi:L-lactate dehydrogenase complex protein LldG
MGPADNPSRERILSRIGSALKTAAPQNVAAPLGDIFPPVGNLVQRFQEECAANNTECIVTPDPGASAAAVANILAQLPPGEVFAQDAPELRETLAQQTVRWSNAGGPSETAQATVTLAHALVAATGSAFVSSACGGRGASVVAPVHIVVARQDDLVPDLSAAFARLREKGVVHKHSMLCLITGSSRTADIEKILVMGAHGPRRLVVVLNLGE